jgi:hypothetical protein
VRNPIFPLFQPFLGTLLLCLALWGLAKPVQSAAFGTTGSLLMAEGLAVRPLGAGFAFSALSDDESSLQVNPAGLAQVNGLAISGGYVLGLLGTGISYLDLGYGQPGLGALGLQAAYFGDTDTQRDIFGVAQGTFQDTQVLLGLALAKELAPGWRLGLQAKGLQETYAGSSTNSVAGDLGLQGPLPHGWRFGAAVLNAGQELDAAPGTMALPTPLRIQGGVSAPFFTPAWNVEADLQGLPDEQQTRLLVGSELKINLAADGASSSTDLALRGGTQVGLLQHEDTRLYVGAGIGLPPDYALDYALISMGALGLSHRFSLTLRFQGKPDLGPRAGDLSAPFGVKVESQFDGLLITWSDANEHVAGYNLYSDYGVLVERLTPKPVIGRRQNFIKVTKSRVYNFYVRPVGSDGKEGPASEVVTWVEK